MTVPGALEHGAEYGGMLLEASETFLQMAEIARLDNSDQDSKVFYSHLAFNCARLRDCLKVSPHLDDGLGRQALGYLGSMIPKEDLQELPTYSSTTEDCVRVLNFHWNEVRNHFKDTKIGFVRRWLKPRASGDELDALDHALESCVDDISKRRHVPSSAGLKVNFAGSSTGEPPSSIWKVAQSVFDALLNCRTCTCSCQHDFKAKLKLGTYRKPSKPAEPRIRKIRGKGEATDGLDFDMFLSMERDWHEVRIHADKAPFVSFNTPGRITSTHSKKAASVQHKVETLCLQVKRTKSKPLQRLELILTDDQLFEMGFQKTNFHIDNTANTISLAQCIQERHEYFTEKTKRVLSLIIGYTVFHLNNTPWLQPGWGSANIKFFKTASGEVPLRPFIETQLDSENGSGDEDGHDPFDAEDLDSDHLCPSLISLAVVLMEIYFIKPFKTLAELHSIQLIESVDGRIALIDVDQVFYGVGEEEEEGWRSQIPEDFVHLLTAIENCLNSELWEDEEGQALDPQLLRLRMYREVIQPLELHLTHGFSNIPLDGVDKHAREIDFAQWGRVIVKKKPEDYVSLLSPALIPHQRIPSPANFSISQSLPSQFEAQMVELEYLRQVHQHRAGFDLNLKSSVGINSAQLFDDGTGNIEGIKKYEHWKSRYKDVYDKFIDSDRLVPPSKPVKIAILDTGIDKDHPNFDAYGELKGKLNCYDESRPRKVPDGNGHGTFVASLILDYAPDADIYVIKISGKENTRPDARIVRKAIDHAVDVWQVDIISMSFGWPSTDFDGYNELQDAIDRAYSKQVLMFAAASNSGGNLGRAYPASSTHVICVHSTDTSGNRSDFSPTPERDTINLATVGESIRSAWPTFLCEDAPGQDYLVSRSGTSYATPVLVGIVAFLLQYAQLRLPDSARKALKRKENVEALLKRCAERGPNYSPRDGYFYVELSLHAHNIFGREPRDVDHEILQVLKR